MAIPIPAIAGQYFAYADILLSLDGLPLVGAKSINYNDKMGRSPVRGTARAPLGYTSGQYEAGGDVEFFKPAADLILSSNPLWRTTPYTITVSYSAQGLGFTPTVDVLEGVMFTDLDAPNADGTEALARKFTFVCIIPIKWGGIGAGFVDPNLLVAVA